LDKKQYIPYNPYFMVPFLVWVAAGGIAIMSISKSTLFFSINTHYSDTFDVLMYYITWLGQAEVIIPAMLLLLVVPRFRNWWFFTTALSCNVIPFLIQHFIKSWLNYPRPLLLLGDSPGLHYLQEWPLLLHSSFPSGHSQGAASFFCFLSLLLPAKYRRYGFLFFILSLLVCYSRIYLAAHFFGDVYAGSILGIVLTTLIYSVMDKYKGLFFRKKDTFI
jgi:membrane-associated phospholipid phosphatase